MQVAMLHYVYIVFIFYKRLRCIGRLCSLGIVPGLAHPLDWLCYSCVPLIMNIYLLAFVLAIFPTFSVDA